MINKINDNLERFNYNVIVAKVYETYNFLNQLINKQINNKYLLENYTKILTVMLPIIPHFASECLKDLNLDASQKWPVVNKKFLESDLIEYVIQVNGKKRGTIKTKRDITEKLLIEQIKTNEKTMKIIQNKQINKSFFVKNRLINILIK